MNSQTAIHIKSLASQTEKADSHLLLVINNYLSLTTQFGRFKIELKIFYRLIKAQLVNAYRKLFGNTERAVPVVGWTLLMILEALSSEVL